MHNYEPTKIKLRDNIGNRTASELLQIIPEKLYTLCITLCGFFVKKLNYSAAQGFSIN